MRLCLAVTQGFLLFSLRRVLLWCGIAPLSCRDAKFLFVFPASCPVVVRDCALVVPRRKVFCCFLCVVSYVVRDCALVLPRRKVLCCFPCVVSCCGARLRLCLAVTQGFLLFSLRRVLLWCGIAPCLAATQGFLLFSLRRVLLWWCEIAPLSCRDAKFCFVFPASRYYMGLFCSEMEHDAKFCADFFASCPLCMIW